MAAGSMAGSREVSHAVDAGIVSTKAIVLLGRFFYVLLFLISAPNHFTKQGIGYAAALGVPLASIAVPFTGVLALIASFSILLGYRAKVGAWLMVLFLALITPMVHRFWGLADPNMAQQQFFHFFKNVSMLGGALLISQFGPGPWSLDARRKG